MIKIRIFSTIGNSTNLMKTYINVTGKSNFKNIRFVDDDSYTHARSSRRKPTRTRIASFDKQ